jgi:hypothetical protein
MNSNAFISQVSAPEEIHRHLDWHHQQGIPLLLMCGAGDGHRPARIVSFEPNGAVLEVVCSGVPAFSAHTKESYAVIGTTPSGANFLASGQMWAVPGMPDGYRLSLPSSIDVAQSRGGDRCPVPAGHLLHFCALDPHLNDVVCRVQNISRGGLAVIWERSADSPPPKPGSLTEIAILQSSEHRVQLGSLRVAHVTARKGGYAIGLNFEATAPSAFDALVRDAQRAQRLA